MELCLTKVQGSGSQFFILDETMLTETLSEEQKKVLSQKLCQNETGLLGGANGLMVVEESSMESATCRMRAINPNGVEARMCGNGLRAVARYASDRNHLTDFLIETMHDELKVHKRETDAIPLPMYQVEIGPVSFLSGAVPMNKQISETLIAEKIPDLSSELEFSVVAVPNPQLVTFVDQQTMDSDELERIGRLVNHQHPLFPNGIHVNFVQILAENELYVRTYKSQTGLTVSSGTGMCASSLLYDLLHQHRFFEPITVRNPGGAVQVVVHQDADGAYWMELIGDATFTHQIKIELSAALESDFSQAIVTETNEISQYQKFLQNI